MGKERLDRILGHMAVGSRREVKQMIKEGRVCVDGAVVADPGLQVDPAVQVIVVDGRPVAFQAHFHVLLHKPGGVITAARDPNKPTVMDVLPPALRRRGLQPVGRLDKDTEGALLFTTDGELAHRLLSPRYHVDKCYLARLDRPLTPEDEAAFAAGVTLEDGYVCLPAKLEVCGPYEALLTIQEGKYHQVKRMFMARGKQVVYLKRLTFGPLALGDLPLGAARPLSTAEVEALYAAVGLARP
jgi:16S rRNA pseudouridine516 synthase